MSAEITFHGTGAGDPSADRGASSATIRSSGVTFLLDAGDGAARALIRDGVDLDRIDFLFLSHYHPDHWTGIPSLVMAWSLAGRSTPVTLFVPPGSSNFLRRVLQYCWLDVRPKAHTLSIIEYAPEQSVQAGPFELSPSVTSHLQKYELEGSHQSLAAPAFGLSLQIGGARIHASQDLGDTADLQDLPHNLDLLICETSHVDPRSVIRLASERSVPRVIFTHIPPDREVLIAQVAAETEGKGSIEVIVAYDGLRITL